MGVNELAQMRIAQTCTSSALCCSHGSDSEFAHGPQLASGTLSVELHEHVADHMYAVLCCCRATRKDVERALAGGKGSLADTLRLLEAS